MMSRRRCMTISFEPESERPMGARELSPILRDAYELAGKYDLAVTLQLVEPGAEVDTELRSFVTLGVGGDPESLLLALAEAEDDEPAEAPDAPA